MKRISLITALLAVSAPVAAQSRPAIEDFRVAGIRVIHKPITANDVIAVRLYLKGGSAALTPAMAGVEEMIVSTATLGTAKYTKDQFTALSTATGTEIGGEATRDYTVLQLRAVREHWDEAWDLFAQAVAHPTFPKAEVELARAQQVNALKQRTDSPDSYLTLLSDSVTYAGHPFARDPQGTPESVGALTRDDLARWHKRRLTKANLLVVVVGNVSRADVSSKIAAAFGSLPATGGSAPPVPALATAKPTVTVVERQLPTNYIQGLYVTPSRASRDLPALQLAARVLSERLFEEVRTKRNLTYAVGSSLSSGLVGRGTLYVTAVEPDTTLKVILTEVRRLQREPVSRDRLKETMNTYGTNYWMSQETNMGQAQQLGLWELTGGGWRNALTYVDRMRAVTPADVQRVATRYLRNARFVVIGDSAKIDRKLFQSL
jgi:predicted Zn-dependent peptidase